MSWVKTSKIQHPDAVRDALGFSGEPDGFDLLKLYERATHMGEPYSRGDLRVAFQIASDPYYWKAFKRYQSLQTIVNAGYFDDGTEPGEVAEKGDLQFLCTPLEHVRRRVLALENEGTIRAKPLVVLETTGCFAPLHDGHVAMMDRAREALEAKGYEVVGGYFSPSHDDYVATKGEDARRLTADYRSLIIHKVLENSDWLSLDPWESRYAPTDVNFTTVVQRLRNYINAHIETPAEIEVAYVFGADNMQFARAFTDKGLAVCVARPGSDAAFDELVAKSGLQDNSHVVFAKSTGQDISSTKVRKGEMPAIQRLEGDKEYELFLKGEARMGAGTGAAPAAYLVRDDLSWATEPWRGKTTDGAVLQKAAVNFRNGLVRAIENAFERSRAPGYPRSIEVVLLSVEDQIKEADRIMALRPDQVVNNDIITGGEHMSIGISRLFNLSNAQFRSRELVPRSGRQDLGRIMGRLQKGGYTIIDDDIATGTTIRLLEEKLPAGVTFTEKIALSELAFKKVHPDRPYAFWDIVDARDFLMGSRSGGLVVKLFNGEVGRAPYILPYTSLVSRAKIPPDQEKPFTAEILRLNKRFFRDIWADVHLKDTDSQFQSLMHTAGFRDRTHMDDLCSWHQRFVK